MNTVLLCIILIFLVVGKVIDFYFDNEIKKLKQENERLKKELDKLNKKNKD